MALTCWWRGARLRSSSSGCGWTARLPSGLTLAPLAVTRCFGISFGAMILKATFSISPGDACAGAREGMSCLHSYMSGEDAGVFTTVPSAAVATTASTIYPLPTLAYEDADYLTGMDRAPVGVRGGVYTCAISEYSGDRTCSEQCYGCLLF